MKISNDKHQTMATCLKYTKDTKCETNFAERSATHSRHTSFTSSRSTMKIGLITCLLLGLIILSIVQTSECRRLSKKNRGKAQPGENDIVVDEGSTKASRRRIKKGKILKTSEQARIITEKRYLKSDWCKSRPLKQVVKTRNGCKGVFINNFCYGQCNSFYIPKELTGEAKEPEAFKSCSFCQPHIEDKVSVTLTCSRHRGKRGKVIKRMVSRIKECRCVAVPDIQSRTAIPPSASSTSASSASTSSSETTR